MKNLIFLLTSQLIISLIFAACTTNTPEPAAVTGPSPPALFANMLSDPRQDDCLTRDEVSPAPPAAAPIPLRSDIQLRHVITTTGSLVRLALDPISNSLFYLDTEANIYQLDLPVGATPAGTLLYTLADIGGAPYTLGLAFGPDGTLYVLSNDSQTYTTRAIIRQGILNPSGERIWSTLAATAPYPMGNTFFDHRFSAIIASPDGQHLYVSSGSRTDHGEVQSAQGTFPGLREVPLTAAIFKIPTGVSDLVLANDGVDLQAYLFATGLRNPFDLAFGPDGALFAVDNGPDADFPEELNWIREGGHYGFPWRLGNFDNPQQFPDYDPTQDPWIVPDSYAAQIGAYHNDPTFPARPARPLIEPLPNLGPEADKFRDGAGCERDAGELGQPAYTFTPHRVPLGLSFDTAGVLSEPFTNDAFVLSYGPSYPTMTDQGRDLLHLELTKVGDTYQIQATSIIRGFTSPIDSLLAGNKLYVLEHGDQAAEGQTFGAIWEVTLP